MQIDIHMGRKAEFDVLVSEEQNQREEEFNVKKTRLGLWALLVLIFMSSGAIAEPPEDDEKKEGDGHETTVEFFDEEIVVKNTVFIIDTSNSMLMEDPGVPDYETGNSESKVPVPTKRDRISRAKYELSRMVEALPEEAKFNIIFFNEKVEPLVRGKLIKASKKNKALALHYIEKAEVAGGTRTDLALLEALKVKNVETIYLLSDGSPTKEKTTPQERERGDWFADTDPIVDNFKTWTTKLKQKITLHTLGFDSQGTWPASAGQEPNWVKKINDMIPDFVNFLKKLAANHDGNYISIK